MRIADETFPVTAIEIRGLFLAVVNLEYLLEIIQVQVLIIQVI